MKFRRIEINFGEMFGVRKNKNYFVEITNLFIIFPYSQKMKHFSTKREMFDYIDEIQKIFMISKIGE